jgi:hypothetical protein
MADPAKKAGRGHMPTFHRKKDWEASVDRDLDRTTTPQRSVHETWRCPACREWTIGAFLSGLCNLCGLARPAHL